MSQTTVDPSAENPADGSPSGRVDQLQQLGQQVLDAVLQAYDPDGTSSLALALHPGQVIADEVVQDGVVNPLRLSTWLSDQYDYPLWLELADGTPIASTALGGVTATSAYVTAARYAQPSLPVDSPAYGRIEALIADARQDIGTDPDLLPFGAEPDDFASPDCAAWRVFDTTITTHEQTSTTTTPLDAGTAPPPRPPIRLDPELWRLRAVSTAMLEEAPARIELAKRSRMLSRKVLLQPQAEATMTLNTTAMAKALAVPTAEPAAPVEPPPAAAPEAGPAVILTELPASALASASVASLASLDLAKTVAAASAAPADAVVRDHRTLGKRRLAGLRSQLFGSVRDAVSELPEQVTAAGTQVEPTPDPAPQHGFVTVLDQSVLDQLAQVSVSDLAGEPATSTVTTQDSDLKVHFEFLAVTITRRLAGVRWWHPELLAEESWYVPGMVRGALVPADDDPDRAWCLPTTLLLVRNVSLTGTWTQEAGATMDTAVHYVGPFLMGPAQHVETSTGEAQQSTMVGSGLQVIGELCTPLPPVPPTADPG